MFDGPADPVLPGPSVPDTWLQQAAETVINSDTNSTSIVSCLEELENVTISKEQVEIVGKAVENVTRNISNPMIAELGGYPDPSMKLSQ